MWLSHYLPVTNSIGEESSGTEGGGCVWWASGEAILLPWMLAREGPGNMPEASLPPGVAPKPWDRGWEMREVFSVC